MVLPELQPSTRTTQTDHGKRLWCCPTLPPSTVQQNDAHSAAPCRCPAGALVLRPVLLLAVRAAVAQRPAALAHLVAAPGGSRECAAPIRARLGRAAAGGRCWWWQGAGGAGAGPRGRARGARRGSSSSAIPQRQGTARHGSACTYRYLARHSCARRARAASVRGPTGSASQRRGGGGAVRLALLLLTCSRAPSGFDGFQFAEGLYALCVARGGVRSGSCTVTEGAAGRGQRVGAAGSSRQQPSAASRSSSRDPAAVPAFPCPGWPGAGLPLAWWLPWSPGSCCCGP
jgi:hypothetical protein